MFDFLFKVLLAVFACIGLVHSIAWLAVRDASKRVKSIRVFPIGNYPGKTGRQMAAMYTCLQWEANPAKEIFVLYDVGLNQQGKSDCEKLAEGAGINFVQKGELEKFIALKK